MRQEDDQIDVNSKRLSRESLIKTKPLKTIAVGDFITGKTCVLLTHVQRNPPTDYKPIVFDNYYEVASVDGVEYEIALWDTAGQEEYTRLRSLSYANTTCFLLCYAIDCRTSFENARRKWYPELKRYCPKVPIILVATNCELRDSPQEEVTLKEGKKMRRKIRAYKHMECSVSDNKGINEIFAQATKCAVKKTGKKHTRACF